MNPPRDPDPDPRTVRELLIVWKRRAEDRSVKAAQAGAGTSESRVLRAAAAEIRQCIAELDHTDRWE
jgi:hypothetical protein